MTARRTHVLVVADTAQGAARIEAMLRGDPALDVAVVDARALTTLAAERAPAIAILAMSSQRAGRLLDTLRDHPRAPAVIVLAPDPHEAWSAHARRAGIRAVLPSDATDDELSAAVAATQAGLLVLHPDALSPARAASTVRDEPGTLTARELEILEMMAEGMSNRAIAARLKISRHTVKFHVGAILARLGARTRAEAVTLGVRHGRLSL